MQWFDWCIAVIPMIFVVGLAFYTRKYIKGVADFLAAGRVAGRYVLCVGDMASGLSVITIVALVEIKYQTGYALE
ncbi:MAG TPA: sodium:solute symporter, partial [Lentisphaeria bacterium]|nr:sodium:solute symporter [Lentisphaeria bacterium]